MKAIHNFKKILIFNPSYIGDTVLTTPLITAVKSLFPEATITFVVRPEAMPLYEGIAIINEVIAFDKRGVHKGFKGLKLFARILKQEEFDLVLNLHKSIRSTIIMWYLKSYVVGFKSAVFSFLFHDTVKRDKSIHEVYRNLSLLEAITTGYSLDDAIKIGGQTFTYTNNKLIRNCKTFQKVVTDSKKVVGFFVGSAWRTKRYPAYHFATVANILYKNDIAIALFGTDSDKEAITDFLSNYNLPYFDYVSKVSIHELPSFLASLDLLLTNDSGPLHIAVSANTKVMAIFGPTVKSQGFFPYDDNSQVIENNSLNCRPCSKHGGDSCPKGHFKCMIDLTPEDIAAKILNTISEA